MKPFIMAVLMSTVLTGSSFGEEFLPSFEVGTFALKDEPRKGSAGCDLASRLVLDEGKILGSFALLNDYVDGLCPVYLEPNTRIYSLNYVGSSCGSKIYEGKFESKGVLSTIKIVDHRSRLCRDLQPARIVVTETVDGVENILYSQPLQICTAIAGQLVDPDTGACVGYTNGCQRAELIAAGFVSPVGSNSCK